MEKEKKRIKSHERGNNCWQRPAWPPPETSQLQRRKSTIHKADKDSQTRSSICSTKFTFHHSKYLLRRSRNVCKLVLISSDKRHKCQVHHLLLVNESTTLWIQPKREHVKCWFISSVRQCNCDTNYKTKHKSHRIRNEARKQKKKKRKITQQKQKKIKRSPTYSNRNSCRETPCCN